MLALRVESWAIRVGVPVAVLACVLAGIALPHGKTLPSAALDTEWLFYAERSLALFYGFLLLFLPLVRALRGQLPIELSMRGARYEEAAAASEQALEALERRFDDTKGEVAATANVLTATLARLGALEDHVGFGGDDVRPNEKSSEG